MKFVDLKYDLFYKIVPHSRRLQYHTVRIFSVYIYYSINETHFLSFCLTKCYKSSDYGNMDPSPGIITQSQHLYTPHDDENDEILGDKERERRVHGSAKNARSCSVWPMGYTRKRRTTTKKVWEQIK